MRKVVSCAFLFAAFFTATALAREAPHPNASDAVFTATHIVIVSPGESPSFTVERNFRGNLTAGSKVDLPTFELITWNKLTDDEVPVPLTEDTRILLFLRPVPKNPSALEVTDYGHAFFFRDVEQIDELEALAKSARAEHKKWKDARDLPDPQERILALFPYLLHSPRSCHELTLEELAKMNPQSGDYLASQLAIVSLQDCGTLLLDIRRLPSPKAHAAAIASINRARGRFEIYLATRDLKTLDVTANWNNVADELKTDYGIIYYGLAAMNSFHDPADAPYIRGLVPFLLANDLQQAIEECIHGMRYHPSPENVAVLISVWKDHKSRHIPPEQTGLPIDLAQAMAVQHDNAVIPSLLEMFEIPSWHDAASSALRELTGKEYHTAAEWKAWYASQSKDAEQAVP